MPKYRVSQKYGESDSDVRGYFIDAADLSDAQQIVLDREGYKIILDNAVDYSMYYQRDKRYSGIKLGKSGLSFQNNGCFTCCLSLMVGRDPLLVMKDLVDGGGMTDAGLIVSDKVAQILGLEYYGKTEDINVMPKYTCIKEVLLGKAQHFVVRLVDDKGGRTIFDPWTGKIQSVNFYTFKSYRLFKVK